MTPLVAIDQLEEKGREELTGAAEARNLAVPSPCPSARLICRPPKRWARQQPKNAVLLEVALAAGQGLRAGRARAACNGGDMCGGGSRSDRGDLE